jgi:hypothetical protein
MMRRFVPLHNHPPEPKVGLNKKILDFIKEWGGVATVVIAVLYTFPFQIFDRIINRQEHDLAEARHELSDASALRAEKIAAVQKSNDPAYLDAINGAYDIRIYTIMISNKSLFDKVKNELTTSELYWIGSSFTLFAGAGDLALPYYNLAIEKAKAEKDLNVLATASREKGATLFPPSKVQNVADARQAYLTALTTLLNMTPKNFAQYSIFLSDFALQEMNNGDWKCGITLKESANKIFQEVSTNNQVVGYYYSLFQKTLETEKKKDGQPDQGCTYSVPEAQV